LCPVPQFNLLLSGVISVFISDQAPTSPAPLSPAHSFHTAASTRTIPANVNRPRPRSTLLPQWRNTTAARYSLPPPTIFTVQVSFSTPGLFFYASSVFSPPGRLPILQDGSKSPLLPTWYVVNDPSNLPLVFSSSNRLDPFFNFPFFSQRLWPPNSPFHVFGPCYVISFMLVSPESLSFLLRFCCLGSFLFLENVEYFLRRSPSSPRLVFKNLYCGDPLLFNARSPPRATPVLVASFKAGPSFSWISLTSLIH